MRTQTQAGTALGPLAACEIQRLLGRDERGGSVPVLALPDASNAQRAVQGQPQLFHAVCEFPRIRRNPDGKPIFSATFLLNRRPELTAPSIDPSTVERAVLGFELDVRPSDTVLRSLSQHTGHDYLALFPRSTNYRLILNDTVVTECRITSFSSAAALEGNLDKYQAQALLASICGDESTIETHADLEYREAAPPQSPTQFEMDLANVYDYLAGKADEQARFTEADLRNYLALMLDTGIVGAAPPLARIWEQLVVAAGTILPQFLRAASYTLEKLPDNPTELGSSYRLRRRPAPGTLTRFDNRMSLAGSSRVLKLEGILRDLLSESLVGEALDLYVHLIGPDGVAIPWSVGSNTRAIQVNGGASFAAIEEGLTTSTHDLRPQAAAVTPAHTLIGSGQVHPAASDRWRLMENISVDAVFMNLIDMPSHHLTSLHVSARIHGVEGERTCDLNETTPVTIAKFLVPLTHHLTDPVVEFKVTRQLDDGTTKDSPLRSWKLSSQGSVIGLVWELIS